MTLEGVDGRPVPVITARDWRVRIANGWQL